MIKHEMRLGRAHPTGFFEHYCSTSGYHILRARGQMDVIDAGNRSAFPTIPSSPSRPFVSIDSWSARG